MVVHIHAFAIGSRHPGLSYLKCFFTQISGLLFIESGFPSLVDVAHSGSLVESAHVGHLVSKRNVDRLEGKNDGAAGKN